MPEYLQRPYISRPGHTGNRRAGRTSPSLTHKRNIAPPTACVSGCYHKDKPLLNTHAHASQAITISRMVVCWFNQSINQSRMATMAAGSTSTRTRHGTCTTRRTDNKHVLKHGHVDEPQIGSHSTQRRAKGRLPAPLHRPLHSIRCPSRARSEPQRSIIRGTVGSLCG